MTWDHEMQHLPLGEPDPRDLFGLTEAAWTVIVTLLVTAFGLVMLGGFVPRI